jgi:hypothetical protein
MDSAIHHPIVNFSIRGSIKENPTIWATSTIIWMFSCFLVWRWQVYSLEQVSRGERIMYTKDGKATVAPKSR